MVTVSWLDNQLFFFKCTKCKYAPPDFVVGRVTQGQSHLDCPACKYSNDLSVDPNRRELAEARDVASETDKRARERGEIVKRRDDIDD
jgi:hypothetical protein